MSQTNENFNNNFRKNIQNAQLKDAIVSTGSDITAKVEFKDGISKTARMYIAKDILCSMMVKDSTYAEIDIIYAYAIADKLIKEGGL